MKVPVNQRIHGNAERSAFSWFLGELLAQTQDPLTINNMTRERASVPPLTAHLTREELVAQEKKGAEGATYLLSVLTWNQTANNCVAFYVPRAFRATYQRRFEAMTKDRFWYVEVNIKRAGSRHRLALVPLPSFMGQTALDDGKLSSSKN